MRPINQSNAQSNNWNCNIFGFEGVTFKLKTFPLPTMSAGYNNLGDGTDIGLIIPGSHIEFGTLDLTFFVEEDWSNFFEVFFWMRNNLNRNQPITKDITVYMLTNETRYQDVEFLYTSCFPTGMTLPTLDANGVDTNLVCTLTVMISNFIPSSTYITENNLDGSGRSDGTVDNNDIDTGLNRLTEYGTMDPKGLDGQSLTYKNINRVSIIKKL